MESATGPAMRIGELAGASGVTARTIRYYESIGLLPVPDRRGSHRSYDASNVERLRRIEMLKSLGLSLEEVAEVLTAYADESASAKRHVAEVLRQHLAETDRRLAALKKFRKELVFRIELVDAYAERDERAPRSRRGSGGRKSP